MVRILSIVGFVLTVAMGAQASHVCQCLFADRSHCCVSVSAYGSEENCQDVCKDKARNKDGAKCNADGAWSHVGGVAVQFREPCA